MRQGRYTASDDDLNPFYIDDDLVAQPMPGDRAYKARKRAKGRRQPEGDRWMDLQFEGRRRERRRRAHDDAYADFRADFPSRRQSHGNKGRSRLH